MSENAQRGKSGHDPESAAAEREWLEGLRYEDKFPDDYEPPYTGDEPLGTCVIHGDYWTDDCTRCGR